MLVKRSAIKAIVDTLKSPNIAQAKLKVSAREAVARTVILLEKELELFSSMAPKWNPKLQEHRNELLRQYGKVRPDGSLETTGDGMGVLIQPGMEGAFKIALAEHSEMFKEEYDTYNSESKEFDEYLQEEVEYTTLIPFSAEDLVDREGYSLITNDERVLLDPVFSK